jgi:hypothetical protein
MSYFRNRRGTSIVEVLVVMVILFVGILTIISLFPPGFLSVKQAQNLTFAGRLAQYEIERWKNNVDNLPDGVLAIDAAGNVLNDQYPGPPITADNAMAFRRIVGETTRIPFGGWSTGPESGSLYVLAFAPIENSAGHPLAIRGGSLTRRVMDAQDNNGPDAWDLLRGFQYAIDYNDQGELPQVCFPVANEPRTYYVSCSWWSQGTNGPEFNTTLNMKIDVNPGVGAWVTLPIPVAASSFLGMEKYSDIASRGFVDVTGGNWSTTDPYQFKLIDPILGIISFNPLGYTQTEFGQALQARIDYDILDPQIIHEDKRIPTHDSTQPVGDPYYVNLSLGNIKQAGQTIEIDGSTYQGLPSAAPPGPDIVAVDLESGRQVAADHLALQYKDGIVKITPDTNGAITLLPVPGSGGSDVEVSPAGRNFRFLYKAEGDWSVQFQKAYIEYERNYGGVLDYKSYFVDGSNPNRLWFSAINGNCSISVEYEYLDNGDTKKAIGETHKTSDILEANPSGLQNSSGNVIHWTYIDLAHPATRIFSVNGISARARVVWRDGEKWRHVDLDTTLVRQKSSQ